jgi:serine/threonine-protein kinase
MLGQILVARGQLHPHQLERAIAAQVLRGGRIGTVLVELGSLHLDDVGRALAEQHGVPLATPQILEAATAPALGAVPRSVCETFLVYPLVLEERALHLAMRDPQLAPLVEHLRVVLGVRAIRPYAVPELRLFYYLERQYEIPRPARYLRDGSAPTRDGLDGRPPQRSESAGAPRSEGDRRSYLARTVAPEPLARRHTGPLPLWESTREDSWTGTGPARPPGRPPAADDATPPRFVIPTLASAQAEEEPEADDIEIVVDETEAQLENAVAALAAATDRADVLKALLAPLLPETSLSVLFLLRGEMASAHGAWGTRLPASEVATLAIALRDSPLFQLAIKDRETLCACADDDALQRMIATRLKSAAPREVCVAPIWISEQPTYLLCVQTASAFEPDASEKLDTLIAHAGATFERLVGDAGRKPPPGTRSAIRRRVDELTMLPEEARSFGRYTLLCRLGSGGMANLYLARLAGPEGFEKLVAIKRIHEHLGAETEFIKMFLDEARLAARITHPSVAQVLELGFLEGSHFIAMEYVEGESLAALMKRVKPSLPTCARIIAAAASGLHAAHELRDHEGHLLNVVHRDVSPTNILISYEGSVKVVDFGVARARSNLHTTDAGTRKGRLTYMAPEQATLEAVDRRADIFALGVMLWEITARKRLFKANSEQETLARVISAAVTPPSQVAPGYPPELEPIVMRALERDPALRYQTAEELQAALEHYIVGTGSPVLPSTLARLMHETFAERIDRKRALLRDAGA